jgi:hypothetical protein
MLKLVKVRWSWNVARMGKKCIQRLVREPERKRPLGNLNVDERMILKRILKKLDERMWTELIWLTIGNEDRHL